jgi:ribosomal protein L15
MFECSCGKKYKYASGLNNHKEKCAGAGEGEGAAAGQGGAGASASASASGGTQGPVTASGKPTVNFTKDDLEALEKRKQARLNTILEAQKKEKDKKLAQDTAAAIQAQAKAIVTAAAAAASEYWNRNNRSMKRVIENRPVESISGQAV